jgi:hypothetical protein
VRRHSGVQRRERLQRAVGGARVLPEVEQHLDVGQELRLAVERPHEVGERLDAVLEPLGAEIGRAEQLVHPPRRPLEDRQHQRFSSAEVVLDHAPRHSRPAGDGVRAGAVEPLVEDALDGGVDHAIGRRDLGIRPRLHPHGRAR